ncbi:MAG: DUF3368 domain-containing protein [Leptolyngbya sp. SIO1E4]|nr:DUF3368 domain-containing protein [Leptolyngbya sp. SIO1E4]
MPINQVVINASPLIALFKGQQAELLPQLFEKIVVPQGVWEEITARKPEDIAAQQLRAVSWIQRVDTVRVPATILTWDLGKGESEVLSWVVSHPDYMAIVDDLAARRCADALGLKVLGTGATLILAKRRGLISNVAPRLKALRDAGLYLSDRLIQLLKEQAGE